MKLHGCIKILAIGTVLLAMGTLKTARAIAEPRWAEDAYSNPETPEDLQYASGMKALNESQWARAEGIFHDLAKSGLSHAAAGYYWQAYAESKLGMTAKALSTCKELNRHYDSSHWVQECEALRIELSRSNGQPVAPSAEQQADLKLLALSVQLSQNEPEALEEIEKMLASNVSIGVKERALFVLAQSNSAAARSLLARVASQSNNGPLKLRAESLLGNLHTNAVPQDLITLNAVALNPNGKPEPGLHAEDFTVLDNGQAVHLTGFRAVTPDSQPGSVHVMIVLDMLNLNFETMARAREQVSEFLAQGGGKLSYPTTIIAMTQKGLKALNLWTQDGKALQTQFDKLATLMPSVGRSAGFYGAAYRMEASLGQLSQIAALGARIPGRKMVLVISGGWPMLSPAGEIATLRERAWTFDSIVHMENGLRESQIALYNLQPYDVGQANPFYYQAFVKGTPALEKAEYPHLSLQVLAEHSGGRVLTSGKDILGELNSALRDAGPYYELTFHVPAASHPNEYHALNLHTGNTHLNVRTTAAYYADPQVPAGKLLPPSKIAQPLP